MAHVDALSRIVSAVNTVRKRITYRQLADSYINNLAFHLEKAEHNKFLLINGLVYRKAPDNPRFVVPDSMVNKILHIHHDDLAHCGVEKSIQGIQINYWFPKLRKKVQNYIDNCLVCLTANYSFNIKEGELQITDSPTSPFIIVHTDHFGPLKKTEDNYKHILVLIDLFSRYTWLFPVRTVTSKEVIDNFIPIFNTFGNFKELVSDRGTAFTSAEFEEFLEERSINID